MARRGWTCAVLCVSVAAIVACVQGGAYGLAEGAGPDYVSDQVLVKFRPGTPASEVARAHAAAGSAVVNAIPGIDVQVVKLPRGLSVARGVGLYQRNPNVEYVEPDFLVQEQVTTPNDPYYRYAQIELQGIHAGEAWDIARGSPDVMIAVLDSGLAYDHPDAQGRYVLGPDFVNDDDDPWDDNGHGTKVYGVVGATTNNGIGIASVAWQNPVLVIKVGTYDGYGSISAMCEGLVYAAELGARGANLSYAGAAYSQSLQDAIDYAWSHGMITVCAAGNYGDDTLRYPAACDHAIGVSGLDGYDELAYYSSYGDYIDVCAPDYMYSLVRDGGYGNAAGTSIASPYVLGAIALVASANPGLSAQQIVDIIEQTADDVGEPGWDEYHGWGKINLHRAVLAAGEGPADDIVGPTVSVSSPAWGEVVCDTVLVSASAIDNVGVIEVQLYLDDRLLGWDTVAPYSWSWDTEGDRDGEHTLIAVACDAAGNSGESSPITVVVDNGPPAAEVVSPAFGSVVAETVRVEALASDLVGVGRVDFYLDGQKKKEAFVPPYVWDWDTKGDANGRHAIVARAVDGAGNACDSQPVEVTVENNAEPIEQTEVFSGRAGGRNGWVSIWVRTNVGGPLRATLKSSGRFALSLYVCNEAGELLARDVSSANFKFADLWVAPGNYEFLIGSIRQKSNFVLEVTHF